VRCKKSVKASAVLLELMSLGALSDGLPDALRPKVSDGNGGLSSPQLGPFPCLRDNAGSSASQVAEIPTQAAAMPSVARTLRALFRSKKWLGAHG
jgi:hypothetical protein